MGNVKIGGQAVIEGVMMKNVDKYAVAVRKPDKEIEVKVTPYTPAAEKSKLLTLPIIRGVYNFLDSMVIGVKTLTYSAEFFEEEEEEPKKVKNPEKEAKRLAKEAEKEAKRKARGKESAKDKDSEDGIFMFLTVALSVVLAVGLFMLLPAFIVSFVEKFISNHFALGLIEGIIRLIIFMLYVILISRMEDIKRTYMYHGAEHKCINCLEAGDELTVENVLKHSRFHKRCGTSFLFIVMMVSILVFMCITTDTMWMRLLLRVLLVPVIAGISYEFIRFAGSSDSKIADVLSKPGLMIQRFTTLEPTADMAEVAIKSVEAVLDWREYLANQRKELDK